MKEDYFREKRALPGPEQLVEFESKQIELDIPQKGVKSEGWVITPLTALVVSADTFETCRCKCNSVDHNNIIAYCSPLQ